MQARSERSRWAYFAAFRACTPRSFFAIRVTEKGERAMKFFIDSADIAEIKEAAALGLIDGCTTNPSLLAKVGRKIESAIPEICEIVDGPVSAEVVATEYEPMLKEARILAKLHKNVVVKVPLVIDGLKAVKTLKKEGIRTNVTLCFSATQALLAAK